MSSTTTQKKGYRQSVRRKNAIKMVVDSGGKMPVSVAMIAAGFSPRTAVSPSKITDTVEWKETMEQFLPDQLLAATHRGLLQAGNIDKAFFELSIDEPQIREIYAQTNCYVQKIFKGINGKIKGRYVWFVAPDNKARNSALDMAYKLKGTYAAEKHAVGVFSLASLLEKTDEA